jgi:outer membrane protein assembly factor BamB
VNNRSLRRPVAGAALALTVVMGGLGTVAANSDTVAVASGALSGRVIQLDGSEVGSVCVEAIPVGAASGAKIPRRDFIFTREETGAAPNFSFKALAAGSYYVEFSRTCAPNGPKARAAAVPGLFPASYYDGSTNGTATIAEAVAVAVSPSKPATGINVQLDVAGSFNWPAALWKSSTGSIAQSSPTVGTYGGMTIAAVGSENGMVYVLDAATGKELPGWPSAMAAPAGERAAVESSPAIAFLHGQNGAPSIVVGSGSTWVHNSVGEVEAFSITGKREWVFPVGAAPGTAVGVISSPAVGDVTGNGKDDIVFGSWDHRIYALTPSGALVPGFPFNNADTIWSSPALYRMPGQHEADIFLGSDASGLDGCVGGWIGDYRYEHGALAPVWRDCEHQAIWSSPAIGVLEGQLAVVVGTSFFYQPFPAGTNEVIALRASNGSVLPGWPAKTAGPVLGSPAIGKIAPGVRGVVDISWMCKGPARPTARRRTDRIPRWRTRGTETVRFAGPTCCLAERALPRRSSCRSRAR